MEVHRTLEAHRGRRRRDRRDLPLPHALGALSRRRPTSNFAAGWPGVEWLIVGLAGGEPEVRSYLIDDGRVTEVEVVVADDGP